MVCGLDTFRPPSALLKYLRWEITNEALAYYSARSKLRYIQGKHDRVDLSVGKDPNDVDIQRDIKEDHKDEYAKQKRKLTSQWSMFETIPLAEGKKKRCKFKTELPCIYVTVVVILEI